MCTCVCGGEGKLAYYHVPVYYFRAWVFSHGYPPKFTSLFYIEVIKPFCVCAVGNTLITLNLPWNGGEYGCQLNAFHHCRVSWCPGCNVFTSRWVRWRRRWTGSLPVPTSIRWWTVWNLPSGWLLARYEVQGVWLCVHTISIRLTGLLVQELWLYCCGGDDGGVVV